MDKLVIRDIAKDFSTVKLQNFLRRASPTFSPKIEDLGHIPLPEGFPVSDLRQLGEIPFSDGRRLIVVSAKVERELSTRSGRKSQYDIAKRVLKHEDADAGLFVFYDDNGRFRMSLVVVHYLGRRRTFSHYRRYTYFVDPHLPNKTFVTQISKADFSSLDSLLEAFSIAAVTDEFYREFEPIFQKLVRSVCGTDDDNLKWDFALLFTIRTIFLGFLQKRGWLGDNPRFLQDFWKEYRSLPRKVNSFYKRWLKPLFFEALRHPPGHKVAYQDNEFPPEIEKALQMAPYLNGELFREKPGVDDQGLWLPDEAIDEFFDFLFQYNFTVEENELYDEELEVNPEFLGIIFERLLNKALGSVYTPRVEVDLMCRWSLVKWLEHQGDFNLPDLYELFFHARESEEERVGDFSTAEITRLIDLLENVQIIDPAAGSGAFLVGMLQVLDEILANLYSRPNTAPELKKNQPTPYERKKHIIGRSLYGVDVHRTAVWIAQLRLWLTLFVDLPEDQRYSQEPLLPNLAFKVRRGDSLVQRVGDIDFPVRGFQGLPLSTGLKQRLKRLAQAKVDFFFNRLSELRYRDIQEEEFRLFREILQKRLQRVENRIRELGGTQVSAFGVGPSVAEQRQAEERKALEKQRDALKRQLQALHKGDVPFLWALEFAEIFTEKGGFDVVIGNPPYVNKEKIRDPQGHLSPREYKLALQRMVLQDFPAHFAKTLGSSDFRKGRKPDGRSDLYTYFFVRTLRLLNPGGIHTFVCSNAWLDAKYGAWLQEFLLHKVPMYFIVDNRARRSFASSDINTVITVFGAPLDGTTQVPADHTVKFVAFRKPFEEAVYTENLLTIEEAEQIVKEADFRVFPISQGDLLEDGTVKGEGYVGNKWGGKYLRAPDIFFTILEKGAGKLIPLGQIAEVNEGRATGANNFFFLTRETIDKYQIEHEFIVPAVMKTRNKAYYTFKEQHVERYLLVLPKNMRLWKSKKVSRYVEHGRQNVLGKSKTLGAKKLWWHIPRRLPPRLIAPCGYGTRVWCAVNEAGAVTSNSYAEIHPLDDEKYMASIFATLNSVIGWLFLELIGRHSLGGGMLKVDPIEYRQVPIILLSNAPKSMYLDRMAGDIFSECGLDPESSIPLQNQDPSPPRDRALLDNLIFEALKLTPEERKEVYRAVCQLVWERISKAKSLKKRQEKKHVDKEPIQKSACGDS